MRHTLLRNERGSIGNLIVVLAFAVVRFVGFQVWSRPKPPAVVPVPPHSVADAVVNAPPLPVMAQPAQPSRGTAIQQSAQIPASVPGVGLTEIHRFIEQGQYAEAEAKLRALSPTVLTDPTMRMNVSILWNNLGSKLTKAGGTAASVSAYKTAVAINPGNAQAFMNLVLAYWETKDAALTPAMLDEAIRLAPRDPMPHIILAERFIEKDDLSSAAMHLQHAKERASEWPNGEAYIIQYIASSRRPETRRIDLSLAIALASS